MRKVRLNTIGKWLLFPAELNVETQSNNHVLEDLVDHFGATHLQPKVYHAARERLNFQNMTYKEKLGLTPKSKVKSSDD